MSMHDPERVEAMRADIDRRSREGAAAGTSKMPEDPMRRHQELQQKRAGDQEVKSVEQEIHELDQKMSELIQDQLERSLNPTAMKMVWDAEQTGEPLFCFRARDFFSVQVISHYASLVEMYGPDDAEFHRKIIDALGDFKDWQRDNVDKVRYPD